MSMFKRLSCYDNILLKNNIPQRVEDKYQFDTTDFIIIKHYENNNCIALFILYNGCINYEGMKILIFGNTNWNKISQLKKIDPHFIDSNNPKLLARIFPEENGWDIACKIVDALTIIDCSHPDATIFMEYKENDA